MQQRHRALPVTGLVAAVIVAACGGATGTPAAPGTQAPAPTIGGAATSAPADGFEGELLAIGPELLAPVFGASVPTPTCTSLAGGDGHSCRWAAGTDGALLMDADADQSFATEEEWRAAYTNAGFTEEIPGVGVAALGGDNPLADGWRASAYTSDGIAYTVTINKTGDQAAVKALVLAVLAKLAA